MTKQPEPTPERSSKGEASRDARAERQAKALRDNLRRRKQQARSRDLESGESENDSPDSRGKSG